MTTKKTKTTPVNAKTRAPRVRTVKAPAPPAAQVEAAAVNSYEVTDEAAPVAQLGRADRHPRTGRARG